MQQKMNTFCLGSSLEQFSVCFDIWKFSCWRLWIIGAENTVGDVTSAGQSSVFNVRKCLQLTMA